MLSGNELEQLAAVCTRIGNDAADEHGFVSIRKLLSRFQAKLIVRPLLVEGMLATVAANDGVGTGTSEWAILIDSDTNQITEADIDNESHLNALPSRLRNTVAHELVHSLAFRPSEFGLRLGKPRDSRESQKAFVEAIERQTERFSPLLLWPESALSKLLTASSGALSIDTLTGLRHSLGISRYVLITRLGLLPLTDRNRTHPGLRDVAIGLGEWATADSAVLRKWPLFTNFTRNVIPDFLHTLRTEDYFPARSIFSDFTFSLCGGHQNSAELTVPARAFGVERSEAMSIRCQVEATRRSPGSPFLFVVSHDQGERALPSRPTGRC